MPKPLNLEDRYWVIKKADLSLCHQMDFDEHLEREQIPTRESVVVESHKPFFQRVVAMVLEQQQTYSDDELIAIAHRYHEYLMRPGTPKESGYTINAMRYALTEPAADGISWTSSPPIEDPIVAWKPGVAVLKSGKVLVSPDDISWSAGVSKSAPAAHELYKDGDADIPDGITDRNGQVVLDCCKKCGKGEAELAEPCPPPLEVDPAALRTVISALIGPPHFIRELQACVTLPGGPINKLRDQYNAWLASQKSPAD